VLAITGEFAALTGAEAISAAGVETATGDANTSQSGAQAKTAAGHVYTRQAAAPFVGKGKVGGFGTIREKKKRPVPPTVQIKNAFASLEAAVCSSKAGNFTASGAAEVSTQVVATPAVRCGRLKARGVQNLTDEDLLLLFVEAA
jgi:hypothetical protein